MKWLIVALIFIVWFILDLILIGLTEAIYSKIKNNIEFRRAKIKLQREKEKRLSGK